MAHIKVKDASRRWMYSEKRRNPLTALLDRGTAAVVAAGLGPKRVARLEVRGRRSGRRLTLPVVVVDHQGERYLVAMLGEEANWVRNVRAAGGAAVLQHGRRERIRLEEVESDARAPILRRYVQIAPGARAHIPVDPDAPLQRFEEIAARYPVFLIRAGAGEGALAEEDKR